MPFVKIKEASQFYGVHPSTLRRWGDGNVVVCRRFGYGNRIFSVPQCVDSYEDALRVLSKPSSCS